MASGDSDARKVFRRNEYAAKEPETIMKNRAMRRQRTFEYQGKSIQVFRHVKIGVKDGGSETIRVHFEWDP